MAASIKLCFCFFLIMGVLGGTMATIYEIGDGSGWNSQEMTNYDTWSSSKKFKIGDYIVFNYNPEIHNVQKVSEEEYKDCSAISPIATYTGGKDQVILDSEGDHYFICSYPGMCQAGQKVKIHVESNPAPPTPYNYPGTNIPIGTGEYYPSSNASTIFSSYNTALVLVLVFLDFTYSSG